MLKEEIEQHVGRESLLQGALQFGNFVADERPTVMINRIEDHGGHAMVRIGSFFAGINAGACCADDPTPVETHHEHCVVKMRVDLATGETQAPLVDH